MSEPRKGTGLFRHCYIGQEDNLKKELDKKNMTLDEFNSIWDHIEKQRDPNYRETWRVSSPSAYQQEPDPFIIDDEEYKRRMNPPPKPNQITRLP